VVKQVPLPPLIDRENIFKENKEVIPQKKLFVRPEMAVPDVISVKTKITLSTGEPEKSNSPSYLAHSQIVREKIKRALYQNYSRMEVGQVYVSFVLTRTGALKDVRLVEEKSSSSSYLRQIAMQSIRDAAPFPEFPKELDYEELSFNVIISFEIE
jgi:TonB family protein